MIDPNSADTLPATLTTGTGHQGAIGLVEEDASTNGGGQNILLHDETWPSMPIPYVVDASYFGATDGGGSGPGQCGIFIDGAAGSATTLSIAAPNTVEFQKPAGGGACGFYVNTSQLATGYPGSLVANGSSTATITFTSASAAPAPGDWAGVQIFLEEGRRGARAASRTARSPMRAARHATTPRRSS